MAEMDAEARYEASVRSFELQQAKGLVTTKLDLHGSRLTQKLTVTLSDEITKQLAAFAAMEACSGIRGNPSAAYKARANHYGGITNWGRPLPIRRWVDEAFSDVRVSQASSTVTKSFKSRDGKGRWGRANSPEIIRRYLNAYVRAGTETRVKDADYFDIKRAVYSSKEYKRLRNQLRLAQDENRYSEAAVVTRQIMQLEDEMTKEYKALGIPSVGNLFTIRTGREIIEGLAQTMRRNQIHAINTMYPPNAEATIAIKSADPTAIAPDKPLIWTGEMINSIESWVNVTSKRNAHEGQSEAI